MAERSDPSPRIDLAIEERGAKGRIARVLIDHPKKLNILNRALIDELVRVIQSVAGDARLRAVVLSGAGERAFIGGADIRELAQLTRATATDFITALHRFCEGLRRLPVPVIARINGHALGAGLEVAAACDLRIASAQSRFGMPEVRVGIPSVIEAALLPGLIGWGRTRRLLLTAETIEAAQAEQWGLIDWCVPEAQLDPAVEELIEAILACGPQALRLQKELIRAWEDLPLSEAIERGIASFASAYESDEPQRMAGAFLEQRARRKKEH